MRSRNHCTRGKAITIKYDRVSVFLPSLSGIQIAFFLGCIMSAVACLSLPYFCTLSHKQQHDFQKNVTEHKMCFDFLHTIFLRHISFCEEFSEILS